MQQEVDIERATIEGGEAISGATDVLSVDGGGRVFAEFGAGELVDRDTVLAWRALIGLLEGGVVPVVVPFCDTRHQPYGGAHKVTYGDGTVHSDGTPFAGGGPFARAVEDAPLRAVTLSILGAFARPLLGGEWFTIVHEGKGERAYKVRSVDPETGQISFRPPLREAVSSGTELDFANPRCLMVQNGRVSTPLVNRRHVTAAIRFVENK